MLATYHFWPSCMAILACSPFWRPSLPIPSSSLSGNPFWPSCLAILSGYPFWRPSLLILSVLPAWLSFLAIFSGDIMAILSGDHFGEVFLTILSDAPVWMGCDKIRNLQNAVLLQKSEGKQMGCATVWLSEASKLYISTEKWGQTHVLCQSLALRSLQNVLIRISRAFRRRQSNIFLQKTVNRWAVPESGFPKSGKSYTSVEDWGKQIC